MTGVDPARPGPSDLDRDPRLDPAVDPAPIDLGDTLRPAVAGARRPVGTAVLVAGAAVAGVLVFLFLNAHRSASLDTRTLRSSTDTSTVLSSAPAPPPDLLAAEAAARAPPPPPPAPTPVIPSPALAPPPPAPVVVRPALTTDTTARRHAPTLVVDLFDGAGAVPAVGRPAAPPPAGVGAAARLSPDEQFAERVGGSAEPERARATMLRNPSATVAQGSVIPAVLETALNSDLPGYARALVSRDVRGFDGSTVLIPRGSRLVGEYRSGVALGASRAFVVWTRLLRPDGASIQIGSPATDELGRAGMAGSVDRHFFQRYGAAVLLSVVNGGVAALTRAPSTSVVIGSSSDAAGLGALVSPTAISPTIKVPQGATIRVFVARDLDFSTVRNPADPRP